MFPNLGPEIQFCSPKDVLEYFKNHNDIDFDSETEGMDPYTCKLLSIQFGDNKHQYVIDSATVSTQTFAPLFNNPNICWNMQNAKFDLRFLYHQKIVVQKVYDTFLAERILTTGHFNARKALDYLVYKYCKQTMDKTVRGNIHREGLSKRVILYAAKDVAFLGEIKKKQLEKIEELDLQKAVDLDNLYVKVLAYIEYSGFKLDVSMWKKKMEIDNQKLLKAREALDTWIIDEGITKYIENQLDLFSDKVTCRIQWSSPKQVVALFRDLGVDTKVKDKKSGLMKDSVEAGVLRSQAKKCSLIPLYLHYKACEKVVSTYGESLLRQVNPISRRIHTNFTQIMDTGRLSSGGKDRINKVDYVNFQNIPAVPEDKEEGMIYARECFIPEKGNTFIVSDYSGQEQIVLANQSLDEDLLSFYDKKLGDMHSFNASKIFPELGELSLTDIKKQHKEKRQIAKSAGFAINYGGNGLTIAQNLSIPVEKGEEVYNAYLAAFPGLTTYWNKNKQAVLTKGYVEFNHVTKRKCFIDFFDKYKELKKQVGAPGFWEAYRKEKSKDSHRFKEELKPLVRSFFLYQGMMERKALNYPVQGTSADITKLAGVYIFKHLYENDLLFKVWMPNVIHDEILLECPTEMGEEMAEITKKSMEDAGKRFYTRVPLKADPYIGPDWTH